MCDHDLLRLEQKETIARFKDRFERIKSSAKQRREEERVRKLAENEAPTSPGVLPTIAEGTGGLRGGPNDG